MYMRMTIINIKEGDYRVGISSSSIWNLGDELHMIDT